jgi:hypothetical protein
MTRCLQPFVNGSHGCLRGSGHASDLNLNLNQSKENQ